MAFLFSIWVVMTGSTSQQCWVLAFGLSAQEIFPFDEVVAVDSKDCWLLTVPELTHLAPSTQQPQITPGSNQVSISRFFIKFQVLPQLELDMHRLCILQLSKGAWPHTQHLHSSLISSLWYFKFGVFFPLKVTWENSLCGSY